MLGIDVTCLGKEEILNKDLVSGIGTFIGGILDYIISIHKQQDYILIAKYYSVEYLKERFPGFEVVSIGGFLSRCITKVTGKSTETILKKYGYNTRRVNKIKRIDKIWFPFAIPEIYYPSNKESFLTIHDFMKCLNQDDKMRYNKMMGGSKKIIVISEYIEAELKQKFPEYKNEEIKVIPSSVSLSFEEKKKYDGIEVPCILNINRYEKHKNSITLLKAFHIYIKKYHGKEHLVFVGFGNLGYKREMEEFARNNNIADKVHFLWRINTSEKNWLLNNASLFVNPSVNEGFGKTPIEAMMSKISVLTTKETSLYEVTKGLANYVENPFDEEEMAEKINGLIKNPISDLELHQIKNTIEREYSVKNIWEQYLKIFDIS